MNGSTPTPTDTCDSYSPLQLLSWALPAVGALGWVVSAVLFWRRTAAERRALPSAATLAGVAIAIPATTILATTAASSAAANVPALSRLALPTARPTASPTKHPLDRNDVIPFP